MASALVFGAARVLGRAGIGLLGVLLMAGLLYWPIVGRLVRVGVKAGSVVLGQVDSWADRQSGPAGLLAQLVAIGVNLLAILGMMAAIIVVSILFVGFLMALLFLL